MNLMNKLGSWLLRGGDPDRVVGIGAMVVCAFFLVLEIWERL